MIVVATTLAAFAMDDPETWGSWLKNELGDSMDEEVRYFAALEVDARGVDPFLPLLTAMAGGLAVPSEHWTFQLDDGRTEVTTANRLRHITMGQNLATDYALSQPDCTHLLFLAADLEPPADCLPKLLELDHPLVGGHVPTYCLDGPRATYHERYTNAHHDDPDENVGPRPFVHSDGVARWDFPAEWDVRVHMASAAFVLIRRDLLRFVRWRWDLDAGMSDDPCLHHDARTFHGVETLVRHDVVGRHHPEAIPRIEERGHDLTVYRDGDEVAADPPWVDHHAKGRVAKESVPMPPGWTDLPSAYGPGEAPPL